GVVPYGSSGWGHCPNPPLPRPNLTDCNKSQGLGLNLDPAASDPLGGWIILTWRRNPMFTRTSFIAFAAVAALGSTAIALTSAAARGGGFGHGGDLGHGLGMHGAVGHAPAVPGSVARLPVKSGRHWVPIQVVPH